MERGMEGERAQAMAKTALEELDEHLRTIGPQRGGGGSCEQWRRGEWEWEVH
jgi:hypothetical protein